MYKSKLHSNKQNLHEECTAFLLDIVSMKTNLHEEKYVVRKYHKQNKKFIFANYSAIGSSYCEENPYP